MLSKLLFLVLCLHCTLQSTIQDDKIHKERIDSSIKRICPWCHDEKLNYKLAKLVRRDSQRSKREVRPVEFEGEDYIIQLNITPVTHDALSRHLPVWTVESDRYAESGHVYKKVDKSHYSLDGVFYEGVKNKALLYATYRNGQIYYDGVIGEGRSMKVIRSLPEKWLQDKETTDSNDHVIFEPREKNSTVTEQFGDTSYFEHVEKLAKPLDILYPKLILVVEYNYFKKLGENIADTVKYLSILWNAVNSKYNDISSPRVKIIISGIIISKDDTALDFISSARNSNNSNRINSYILLNNGTKYFNNQFEKEVNFINFNSAVVMTSLRAGVVAGSAYVAKICEKNVIYVSDDTNFESCLTATHELGHSLGLTHDSTNLAEPPFNSTIMSPYSMWTHRFYWSQHSLDEIKAFATTKYAACLETPYRI